MKKILLMLSLVFAISLLVACTVDTSATTSANWSKSVDGVTECGGTVNGVPYKAISMFMEDPTVEEIDNFIEGKVSEGYDIALAIFLAPNVQFRIEMDVDKGYTSENAQWFVNELVRKAEAAGEYDDDMFVETVKEFMEAEPVGIAE